MIKLMVADDETLVRQALVSLLSLYNDFQIVAEAANGEEAVQLAEQTEADVVLMDIQMPAMNGVEALRCIKSRRPSCAVLMLTTYDNEALIVDAVQAGAGGYLMKDAGADEIASAVRAIAQGYTTLGASVAPKLLSGLISAAAGADKCRDQELTPREKEILRQLAAGKRNKDIAEALGITEKTVRDHIVHILQELNLRDRTQAALWAQANGMGTSKRRADS